MIQPGNFWRYLCLVMVALLAAGCTGCCVRARTKPVKVIDKGSSDQRADKNTLVDKGASGETIVDKPVDTSNDISDKDKLSAALYRRLENAFDMLQSDNLDGAQREIERVQLEINNDPHLEMQSWYLSAMIYHKSGKTSRRKRSMRKMLESMEQLQKDPRFRRSFEDGMMSQEVIKLAIEKGDGRYVE